MSSPTIYRNLVRGLTESGVDVINLGMIPTPVSYYSSYVIDVNGAVMITGSHNPPEYNGFKVTLNKEAIYGERIQQIRDLIENDDLDSGAGSVRDEDIQPAYVADLAARLKPSRRVGFAADAGNGVGALTAKPLFEKLNCTVHWVNADVDGNFPNHHPDPTVEANLEQLRSVVLDHGLELGVAYDGDADRIGIMDERGEILWGDQILAILARSVLRDQPGATVIGEVKCSKLLFDDIERHGGKPLMWKVGHSLIKDKMHTTGALLAGEMSGHIFFKHRYYGFDDAVYVTGRFIEIVAESTKPVSRLLDDWQKLYNTPEIRLDCSDDIKFEVVKQVRDLFRNRYDVNDIDGMRVTMPGGWGLLRPSNTQPVVVMRFEAESEKRLQEIRREVESVFIEYRDRITGS